MYRPHRTFLPFALAALLAILALGSAPTYAQDEEIELRVWDQFTEPGESAAVDAIYAGFTEANPNIKITREAFDTDQMRETVNTAISSGT